MIGTIYFFLVHREVAKDYAQLINPLQHDDWAEILRTINATPKPSSVLGLQRFREKMDYFSQKRMVEEHVQAYKSLVN